MAQLWKIRLPNGKTLTPSDWTGAEPLYSTVELGSGPFPILTAFTFGLGGEVPGSPSTRAATLADTNLEGEGARLPENEELIAYSLAIECFMVGPEAGNDVMPSVDAPDVSLANMLRLQRDVLVITRIAYVKEYTRAPLGWFAASTGVNQANAAARTAISGGQDGYMAANNGGVNVADARHLASPLYIAGGESIAVDIKPGPGSVTDLNLATNSRIRMRILFEGYRRRPVS